MKYAQPELEAENEKSNWSAPKETEAINDEQNPHEGARVKRETTLL